MRREIRVLGALGTTSIPHPRLIAASPDEDVLGVAFYLMEPVIGFNPANGLPSVYREQSDWRMRMAHSTVEGCAALGDLDYVAIGLTDFGRPQGFLERQTARWMSHYEGYSDYPRWVAGGGLKGLERVATWLDRYRPDAARPGLMHGDFHMANAMYRFDRPELAAIVDWEMATIGDPLLDLGWLIATWPERPDGSDSPVRIEPWSGFPGIDELVAHYGAHSTRNLDAIDWYKVMACFKLAIILEGTYARASAGKADKVTGDRLHGHATGLIGRALRWAR